MDVPKGKLAVRPGAVPVIEDRLVYTAIVDSFAERIDKALKGEGVVPSYRVQGGKKRTYSGSASTSGSNFKTSCAKRMRVAISTRF